MPSSKQNIHTTRINMDSNHGENENQNQNQSIFQSPFIGTRHQPKNSFPDSTPILVPHKYKHESPIKRMQRKSIDSSIALNGIHSRNRKPLIFNNNCNKNFSLLDDFQNGDATETIDLFPAPNLRPPHNIKLNNFDNDNDKNKNNKVSRNFFDFETPTSSEGNFSIFSMMPATGSSSPAFDFNSYLLSVTSNLQMVPKVISKSSQGRNLLDLSKPLKLDVLQEKDRSVISENNIMDDMELDCVVRSSVWDSDTETDDELELHLNLDNEKDVEEGKNEASDNAIDNSLRNDYDLTSDDYLKYFNQSMTSKPTDPAQSHNQSHSIPDRNQNFSSPKFTIASDISSMSKPVRIYSDPQPKLKSPISSQGSDETLHDDEIQPNVLKYNGSNTIHQKRTINFSPQYDHMLDIDMPLKRQIVDTRKCSPHHHIFSENLRSALKPIPKALLNLIVESSDGSLEDATKYATEINAQNSEGIPIPEKTTELVNIPTTAPSVNGVRKSAIVRGVRARTGSKKKTKKHQVEKSSSPIADLDKWDKKTDQHNSKLIERQESIVQANENRQNIISNIDNAFKGFYSLREKQQFGKRTAIGFPDISYREEDKENIDSVTNEKTSGYRVTASMSTGFKRAKVVKSDFKLCDTNGKKKVNWAENLEW